MADVHIAFGSVASHGGRSGQVVRFQITAYRFRTIDLLRQRERLSAPKQR